MIQSPLRGMAASCLQFKCHCKHQVPRCCCASLGRAGLLPAGFAYSSPVSGLVMLALVSLVWSVMKAVPAQVFASLGFDLGSAREVLRLIQNSYKAFSARPAQTWQEVNGNILLCALHLSGLTEAGFE